MFRKLISRSLLRRDLILLVWVLPLVLIRSQQQSLMAHDEGIYAAQARAMVYTGDWVTLQWGNGSSFDRTIGIQWLISGCYRLWGISEGTTRLPSAIAWVVSVLLTDRVGRYLLSPRGALLGAMIFSVMPLVAQYGRLGTQDMVLVSLELLAIWALLRAEAQSRLWAALAGMALSLGFLVKGFMVIPAAIALLPYLVGQQFAQSPNQSPNPPLDQHRPHRHLSNPLLYLGLALGTLPTIGWLWAARQQYGDRPIVELFGKLFHLGKQTYLGAGPLYYLWNIPANGFPWVFLAVVGLGVIWRKRDLSDRRSGLLLLLGYPIVLTIELTLFGTRTHYYPLQLMPFLALWAAIGLGHLSGYLPGNLPSDLQGEHKADQRWFQILHWGLGGLGGLLLLLASLNFPFLPIPELSRARGIVALVGLGWIGLWAIWRFRGTERQWLAGWLLTSWLAIATLYGTGLWGNYNPQLKTFLQTPEVAQILQTQTVQFVVQEANLSRRDRKTYLLLNVYTPQVGRELSSLQPLKPSEFAFVDPNLAPNLAKSEAVPSRPIATFEGWMLMQRGG